MCLHVIWMKIHFNFFLIFTFGAVGILGSMTKAILDSSEKAEMSEVWCCQANYLGLRLVYGGPSDKDDKDIGIWPFDIAHILTWMSLDIVKNAICTIVPILKSLIPLFESHLWWMEPLRGNKKSNSLQLLSICQELDWTPDFWVLIFSFFRLSMFGIW